MANKEQIKTITAIATHPAPAISAVKDGVQGGTANYLTALTSLLIRIEASINQYPVPRTPNNFIQYSAPH